ncbi:MAG: extracellular solute-binding protein [Chloroflexia bacterium]
MRRQKSVLGLILGIALLLLLPCCTGGILVIRLLRPTRNLPPAEDRLTISFLYSPEKEAWLAPLLETFNREQVRVGGRPVYVEAEAMDSGEALEAIVEGDRAPVAWSPASTLWVPLLNARWQERTGSEEPLAIYPQPLVVSPLVIAMWEEYARAMGYPEREIGWREIISATLDPRGWGAYGHPEWGAFTLGHTNPYFSNSGLLSIAAEGYAAAGKVRDLSPEDLARPSVRAFVQEIEQAIVHYGESTEYFARQMAARGPGYASAVVLEEQTVVRLNAGAYGALPQRLVAIYPREGTFWSDHPFVILRGEWVDPEEQAAALLLRDFILSRPAQEQALAAGFRPAETAIPLTGSMIDPAYGVDPFQPRTVLEVPSARVTAALLQTWQGVRKRVNVLLVVDVSGSMEGEKLAAVQDGLKLFLSNLADDDSVGVLTFNDEITQLSPMGPLGPKRGRLAEEIDRLEAGYKTILHEVTLEALRQANAVYDPNRINAVVLMSDGLDTASRIGKRQMLQEVERYARSPRAIRIFTIAYGGDADRELLEQIATLTGGRMVEGTPENIRRVYVILSSYF